MSIPEFNPSSTDGLNTPLVVIATPTGGGTAYHVFEIGLGEECQLIQRLTIGDKVYKAQPVPNGPIQFDVDAKNGGKITILQVDTLPELAGQFLVEAWDYAAGDRKIKGISPTRRFMVLALQGDKLKVQIKPLGWTTRGPSVWKLSPITHVWNGV